MTDDLRTVLRARLTTAMKQRDRDAIRALRSTIAAIDNAEAPALSAEDLKGVAIERSPAGVGAREVSRITLTASDVEAIVQREIEDRLAAASSYEEAGQAEAATRLRREAEVLGVL
ncbi:MAG TPA: hypothetical protein VFH54_05160 [Mycobacteriales bacterium]|nr:hypothetical protein [Mycobacteriales bacterium]